MKKDISTKSKMIDVLCAPPDLSDLLEPGFSVEEAAYLLQRAEWFVDAMAASGHFKHKNHHGVVRFSEKELFAFHRSCFKSRVKALKKNIQRKPSEGIH